MFELPKRNGNLVLKVLIPLCSTLVVLLIIGLSSYQKQLDNNLKQFIENQSNTFSSAFYGELHHKTKFLSSVHLLLEENEALRAALLEGNIEKLFELSLPLLEGLDKSVDVSHFYFTDINRVNLLRVHAPNRNGDLINRPTMLRAEALNDLVVGVGLGPLGTLTLRAVNPWVDEEGQTIGYVELGIDVEHIIDELSEENDFGIMLVIPKSKLDRDLWQEGQIVFGEAPAWDMFSSFVMGRQNWLDEDHANHLPDIDNWLSTKEYIISEFNDGSIYSWSRHAIKSLDETTVGIAFVAIDVSAWHQANSSLLLKNALFFITISFVLIVVIYRYSKRAMNAEEELSISHRKLEKLATYDQLTLLPNRVLFDEELEHRLKEAGRFNSTFAVLFIDIDDFKMVNDTMGHEIGDTLLQQVAKRLKSLLRDYDVLARFGGDEFVLMMPQTEKDEVAAIASKLLSSFSVPFSLKGEEHYVNLSIGISMYPVDGHTKQTLLRSSDTAMYLAKQEGKGCFRFFSSSMNHTISHQKEVESKLRLALENNQFELFYQPQIDIDSGKMIAVEALIRWQTSTGEYIPPGEFIPVAEKSNLIDQIGDWVLHEACRQAAEWKKDGRSLPIEINFSGSQLNKVDLHTYFSRRIEEFDLSYSDIGIELTENSLIDTNDQTLEAMSKLVEKGVRIAVDDFGTGYSSLSYLKKFPVTTVKIDQSFTRDAHTDPNDKAIIKAIAAMGKSLGLCVIIEGVETEEQLNIANEVGCDIAQGYYFSKPLPVEKLV